MDTYEVRKNDINDFKYIVFKQAKKQAIKQCNALKHERKNKRIIKEL